MTGESPELVHRRTGVDVVLGIVVVVAGLFLLGNTFFATAISVLLLGWTVLVAGVVEIISAFWRIRSGGFFSAALGGAILTVLGVFILRNPLVGAVALTLLAGSLFLASGLTRIFASAQFTQGRWLLIASGVVSVLLGLWVLFNIGTATLTLLGTLLGVQTLLEGLTLLAVGRLRKPKSKPES
ncbi:MULTISPECIES: HdeD family acid-resistance protein [unclassified Ornithinimicrobium]|uniref:HdeD family acid-resistance protein n=1 Tax=unclassified Ornithinimicrobium TaxID=2615080 RepID=UPI0038548943